MKKTIISFGLVITLIVVSCVSAYAGDVESEVTLADVYAAAYEEACSLDDYEILDDVSAYAYLLDGQNVDLCNNKFEVTSSMNELSIEEQEVFVDFLERTNKLLELEVIYVDQNYCIYPKEGEVNLNRPTVRAVNIELMPEARAHAEELIEVYDNAIMNAPLTTAGFYFAERVKTGGAWDYKAVLGTNTVYYETELQAYMTGETIGNFHYGYAGSGVFTANTLKTAAGFYQIISGTSNLSFWDSYFDDPQDTADIQWGINTYWNEN